MSVQTFENLLKNQSKVRRFTRGDLVEGTIVGVSKKEALVDIGGKSEAILPSSEFGDHPLSLNEAIWVYILSAEDREGQILASLKKAEYSRAWLKLAEAQSRNQIVEFRVTGHNKGGLTGEVFSVSAFVPFSHLETTPDPAWERPVLQSFLDKLRGQILKTVVLELSEEQNRVVLSETRALEEQTLQKRTEELKKLKVNDLLEAEISAILPYGLQVNILPQVQGLIPLEEIAFESSPEVLLNFQVGQKVSGSVIEIDESLGRVKLSLKRTQKDPWQEASNKFKKGIEISGTIVKITSFGVFVELEEGIEGMLPLSELPKTTDLKLGEKLEVEISSIDAERRLIGLRI